MRLRLTVLLALALTPGLAAAAPAKPAETDADSAARRTAAGKTTIYDFENDKVDGEVLSPEGANISTRMASKYKSLITIRPHFIPEMLHMANDV